MWNCETHGKATCWCGISVGEIVQRRGCELSIDERGRHYIRGTRAGDALLAQRVVAELRRQSLPDGETLKGVLEVGKSGRSSGLKANDTARDK